MRCSSAGLRALVGLQRVSCWAHSGTVLDHAATTAQCSCSALQHCSTRAAWPPPPSPAWRQHFSSSSSSDVDGPPVRDRILLRGLVFHGHHGVYPEVRGAVLPGMTTLVFWLLPAVTPMPLTPSPRTVPRHPRVQETKLGQKFVVDATLLADLSQAGRSDDLAHTVNYAQVYE